MVIGKGPAAKGGLAAIIILAPQNPVEFPLPSEKPYMDQVNLSFIPPVLLIRTGQQIDFRNSDDVLHNVRVREETTKEGTFNVAIPTGEVYTHAFKRDGFYDVGCDIHPGMSAQILSASTPYTTVADNDGNFVFADVVPGSYTITVYAGAKRIEQTVEVKSPRTEVSLLGE